MSNLRAFGFIFSGAGIGVGLCILPARPGAGVAVIAINLLAAILNFVGLRMEQS